MSLKWEAAIITAVLDSGDIRAPLRAGIKSADFADQDCKNVWQYLVRHYQDPKLVGMPSDDYIESRFPGFDFVDVRDDMTAIIERVKEARLYRDIRKLQKDVKEAAQTDDAFAALRHLKQEVMQLTARNREHEVVDVTKAGEEIIEEYEHAKRMGGVTGLEYPWETLTEDTGGAQGGDLFAIGGRPGSMKTWTTLAIGHHWHLNLGKRVLVFTKEMKPKLLRRRLVSMFCELDYNRFRKGQLTPEEEQTFYDNVLAWAESDPFNVTYLTTTGLSAIAEVQATVDDFEPDAILIDGFYFVGERDWSTTAKCTSALKDMLIKWDIPAVINTQLNQETEKVKGAYRQMGGGAYGDSYAQDSDLWMKLKMSPENKHLNELCCFPNKIREGIGRPFVIHAKPGGNLGQKHLLDEDDFSNVDTSEPDEVMT